MKKSFWPWYGGLIWESFGATFKLWGHDWSGWIPMIFAVIIVVGGWFGFSLTQLNITALVST